MSKPDIRNFFSVKSKSGTSSKVEPPKRKIISDSDEEEENKRKENRATKKEPKKRRIIDSDEEDDHPGKSKSNGSKKPNLGKLKEKPKGKEVNLSSAFSKSPVKRFEKEARNKPVVNIEIPSDDEFEKSLIHMEEDVRDTRKSPRKKDKTPVKKSPASLIHMDEDVPDTRKSPRKKDKPVKKSPAKKQEVKSPKPERVPPKTPTPSKTKPSPKKEDLAKPTKTNGHHKSPDKASSAVSQTPPVSKKPSSSAKKSTAKKDKPVDLETSVQMDEERHERRQMQAVLFQKYKNRTSVINPGCKPIPEGRPNCFAGKIFLVTGILESLERAEAEELIKKYGGKVSSGVTKKLNFMVTGEEAGPAKLAKAEEYGVKQISEDDLLDMIARSMGGERKKPVEVKKESPKKAKTQEKKVKTPEKKKKAVKEEPEEEFQTFSVKKKLKLEIEEEATAGSSKETDEVEKKDQPAAATCDVQNLAWVDKYKPTSIKQIIGQQGAASNTNKLLLWLKNWYSNHDGKKKLVKPSPWAKNDDGAYFKAALLSGPPGIGKTTTATLVCRELGFDTVEFNASDTRSKRLLKEQVSELLKNKSLYGYMHGNEKQVSSRHVLLMDEVDGMAGNEDRGGMAELIGLIKESSIPVICMCNDRNHQKMRSLVNYCFDLRFQRPRMEQIKGAMMSVCFKEQMKVDPKAIEEIITASNNDIRQTINYLAMLSAGKNIPKKEGEVADRASVMKKDLKVGPWEVVRKVFSAEEHKKMSMNDKADLFFQDYSMGPLFVQENYLQVCPAGPKADVMTKVAKAASSLSRGDLIERRIRSNNNWSVLPVQAMFSSVIPGEFMSGHVTGQINFPGWLGKNSKRTKRSRLAQEIHDHTRVATSGSRTSIRMDYAPYLLSAIVRPLKEEGLEGVPKALEVMREYRISREDIDGLIELTSWPGMKNPMDAVESKVKAALTRAYNKEALAFVPTAKKKSKAAEGEEEFLEDEEGGEEGPASDDEDPDKIDNDALIKQKKKPSDSKGEAKPKEKKEKKETTKKTAKKK